MLKIDPLHEKTEGAFGGIIKSISLSLTLNELAIEGRFEDRRVATRVLFINQELGSILVFAD